MHSEFEKKGKGKKSSKSFTDPGHWNIFFYLFYRLNSILPFIYFAHLTDKKKIANNLAPSIGKKFNSSKYADI